MDATSGLTVLAVLSIFFALVYWFGRNELVRREVMCPRDRSAADVEVVQRYARSDKPVRVNACSRLPNPRKVDCGQECLKSP